MIKGEDVTLSATLIPHMLKHNTHATEPQPCEREHNRQRARTLVQSELDSRLSLLSLASLAADDLSGGKPPPYCANTTGGQRTETWAHDKKQWCDYNAGLDVHAARVVAHRQRQVR